MIKSIDDFEVYDEEFDDEWISRAVFIPALGYKCAFRLSGFSLGDDFSQFNIAIHNFINLRVEEFKTCEEYLFQYYLDVIRLWSPAQEEYKRFDQPSNVWDHITFNDEIEIRRRKKDQKIYISISGRCDWEVEHGLQVVFCEGNKLVKVSDYNGHLTNSDAYVNPIYENIIYKKISNI